MKRMKENNVYIIGAGITVFGEFYDLSVNSLANDSLNSAIEDSKIDKSDIQKLYTGSLVSDTQFQTSIGASCRRDLNLDVPYVHIQAGNASGAAAFHQAYLSILSGSYDCIAVTGAEKLSDFTKGETIEKILGGIIDYSWEFEMGATITSQYAILTKAHMKEYKTTLEQLASVPVKNHKNGVNNPNAQFRREISIDRFLKAKRIADPIGKFDPATYCDGSSTVILASKDFVEKKKDISNKIPVLASSQGSDSLALHHRHSLTEMQATRKATSKALTESKISIEDINLAEVHDSYPIGEILAIEDIGFFKKGEGGKATEEGLTQLNAKVSINTSGGLKARGDPFGATGIAQIIEIVKQMKGEAEKRQVNDINFGLTQNIVGTGSIAFVNILGAEEVKK